MKKILFILFCLVSIPINATSYYVKNGGSDSNSGLSDATAWAHHPWMSTWTGSVSLVPSDIVYMKKGDSWTIASPTTNFLTVRQSGSSENYITTSSYGTGAKPILKITTNSNWPIIYGNGKSYIKFDGLDISHYSSAYENSNKHGIAIESTIGVPHDWVITNCTIHDIPHSAIYCETSSYNMVIGDTTALATATTESYSNNIYNFGYCGIMLQGANPSTGVSNFRVYYNYVHDATRTVMSNNEYGISITASTSSSHWPNYVYVRYNNVQNIKSWEGISTHGGSNIYFEDNYVRNFGTRGLAIMGTYGASYPPEILRNVYARRNIVEATVGGWVTGNEDSFIHVAYMDGGVGANLGCYNIFVENNKMFNTARPSGNTFYAIRFGNTTGITISGNKIYNGRLTSGRPAIFLTSDYGTVGVKNAVIRNNIISQWFPAWTFESGVYDPATLTVIDNIITPDPIPEPPQPDSYVYLNGVKVVIKNNTIIK